MPDKPIGMTEYESNRWDEIQRWRSTPARELADKLPPRVREGAAQMVSKAAELWDKAPGNDAVELAIATAISGGFDMVLDVTESTINEPKVVKRVTKDLPIRATCYTDLRGLDLATLDRRAPKNAKKRAALAAGHGAAAGFIAGGAWAAGATTGGMGALPAAGIVVLTVVADSVALSLGAIQGAAYVGAHYGYDPSDPAERAMLLSLLVDTAAADTAKGAALLAVRRLALDLAAKRTVKELSEDVLYRMMLRIYGSLMLNTAKRSIAKGVPALGVGVGAATNYGSVRRTIVAAGHAYPQQWLLDKYSSGQAEIVDVEVVQEAVDAAIGEEDRGILDRLDGVVGSGE